MLEGAVPEATTAAIAPSPELPVRIMCVHACLFMYHQMSAHVHMELCVKFICACVPSSSSVSICIRSHKCICKRMCARMCTHIFPTD